MSENLLKALMQLFAIVARPDSNEESRRPLVEDFLKQQLNQEMYEEYLTVFDQFYQKHQKRSKTGKTKKYISASSVKVLTICTMINKELNLKQRIIVLIRLLEFINEGGQPTSQEIEFVNTVADTFKVIKQEYLNLKHFVFGDFDSLPDENLLVIDKNTQPKNVSTLHLDSYALDAPIYVYQSVATLMHVFIYRGEKEMSLNGQLIHKDKVYVLSSGSAIRDVKRHPLYYSDIVSAFKRDKDKAELRLDADNISYQFRNGVYGVRPLSFTEESGKLIGIMGASGSGKSTLLNVLNGNLTPTTGSVHINGFDVHNEQDAIEGIIGYVSQDDLLIEDLTVFQNLYFNAKLCFGNQSKFRIFRMVTETLKNLGLFDIKHMKVGSPLNKKISGGQRKRLNIALELIRKPEILFLDEPTSGLSSADSENIMDLLKELTLQGKMIFLVIHQPSSEIFKMFDRLILLDQGGYPVYDGDPVDSIVYFKSKIKQADWSAGECSVCGTVNPEQLFTIIESRVLDEYGNLSSARKKKPHEWYELYKDLPKKISDKIPISLKLPEISFRPPGRFKQFLVFTKRDILAKTANIQYLLLNLLEAPILVFLLAYIIKYYSIADDSISGYLMSKNENLPVYIFMAVIVAVFIGLTMSADEIIKDRTIRKRESFLHLSRSSYLLSKIFILFIISAYQAFVFVLIGNSILEIKDMFWEYWLVLFSTWAFSVLMGLNISDGFKTTITIYIIIPFLIIPQIILSGIIVRYEKLNPAISSPGRIPWYGEIITARWAYEALAVEQFTSNKYMKPVYKYERIKYQANYKKDIWLKELRAKLSFIEFNLNDEDKKEEIIENLTVIRNELNKEQKANKLKNETFDPESLKYENLDKTKIEETGAYFDKLQQLYIQAFRAADKQKNDYVMSKNTSDSAADSFAYLKKHYTNESLEDFVTNRNEVKDFIEYENELFQKKGLIYLYPKEFVKAHFYAPKKKVFGLYYRTLYVNVVVIWLTTILLYISLYYRWLHHFLEGFRYLSLKFKKKSHSLK
jgi:ABC transport system ATP-binding/permease protein